MLWSYHDSTLGEHRGANKTYDRIRKIFYWENRPLRMPLKITSIAVKPFDNLICSFSIPKEMGSDKGKTVVLR